MDSDKAKSDTQEHVTISIDETVGEKMYLAGFHDGHQVSLHEFSLVIVGMMIMFMMVVIAAKYYFLD